MRPPVAIVLALLVGPLAIAQTNPAQAVPETKEQIEQSIQKYEALIGTYEGVQLVDLYSQIALGYLKLKRTTPAIDALEHANRVAKGIADKLDPIKFMLVQADLAVVLDGVGKQDRAVEVWKDILSHRPNEALAMRALAFDLAETERELDSALDYAMRAATANPRNAGYTDTVGWVHFKRGQIDEAIVELTRANLESSGDRPQYRGHLATALRRKLGPTERDKTLIGLLEGEYSKDGEAEIRRLLQSQ